MVANMTVPILPPDETQGPMLLASVIPIFGLAFIVYSARVWTRLRPKYALTAADYTVTVAMIAKTISIGFMVAAIRLGFGKHNAHIPKDNITPIFNCLLGVFMTGVIVSGFARVSIACLLLRFTTSRWLRATIWTTMAVQASFVLTYLIVQLVQCRPSTPAMRSNAQCMTKGQIWTFTYVSVSICMVSDLVCAIIPIFIIRTLSRSVVEKTLISILLASSLIASGCGIPKLYHMIIYDFSSTDGLWNLVPEFFWCRMEEAAIIIAACSPLLKSPIERLLQRFGLPTFAAPTRDLNLVTSAAIYSGNGTTPWLQERRNMGESDLDTERRPEVTETKERSAGSSDRSEGSRNGELSATKYGPGEESADRQVTV